MVRLDEDNIENFIRENRDKFVVYNPPVNHRKRFLLKLNLKFKQIISVVPFLIRVAVLTILVSTASILIWNNYIRKDRYEITLRNKLSQVIYEIKLFKSAKPAD